jgi:hypothetical protein
VVVLDDEFIEKYLSKTFDAEKRPLAWDDVFGQKGEKP